MARRTHDHVLRERLGERKECALRVEPRVEPELLLVGLERLDHATDPKLKVALCAVERADHQVDDAQVEALPVWVVEDGALLLLLHRAHELLRLLVLARHDVRDAQVGEHDRRYAQQLLGLLLDDRLVVANRLLELALLHEEDVRNVKLPHVVL